LFTNEVCKMKVILWAKSGFEGRWGTLKHQPPTGLVMVEIA